ncbi:hypothetical protein ACFQ51_12690 [Streptomyces kaempferi]
MRDEDLFARDVLGGPFTLCPATGDRATALAWLDPAWGAVGIEGVVPKGSEQRYLPGKRTWIRVRSRMTTEVIIAGATGAVTSPASLPPTRYDDTGRLRLIARTTPLPAAVRRDLGGRLRAAAQITRGTGGASPPAGVRAATWTTPRCYRSWCPGSSATPRSAGAATGAPSASCVSARIDNCRYATNVKCPTQRL